MEIPVKRNFGGLFAAVGLFVFWIAGTVIVENILFISS